MVAIVTRAKEAPEAVTAAECLMTLLQRARVAALTVAKAREQNDTSVGTELLTPLQVRRHTLNTSI